MGQDPRSLDSSLSPELWENITAIPDEIERSLDQKRSEQIRLQIIIYLIPFAGFLPAIWRLYHAPGQQRSRNGQKRREQEAARLAVSTGGLWAIATVLLATGSFTWGDTVQLQTLVLASLLTSGYFLTNVWLMIQVLRRQRLYLPGLSEVGQRLVDPRSQQRQHRP